MTPVGFAPVFAFGGFTKDQRVLCFLALAEANPVAAATLEKSSRRCGPNFTETLLPDQTPDLNPHPVAGPDFESGASAINVALETGWADSSIACMANGYVTALLPVTL